MFLQSFDKSFVLPIKERKLLMILTVALLNGPFIACTTGKLPQQSQKLRKKLKIEIAGNKMVFPWPSQAEKT
jgi:hypothetical protein